MGNRTHEWVQNFINFEAVLSCTHELGVWDREQTLRAYQTFGFDDATTNGNELSFAHIDTGVMVLHDGGVVAIQYGEGGMVNALADLFTTLNALGWKTAEVYHPQDTMDALLTDMGKAIPGHLDFDVHPSGNVALAVEDSEEARQLLSIGANLMEGVASSPQEAQDFNRSALSELQSMADEENHGQDKDMLGQLDDGLDVYAEASADTASAAQVNPATVVPIPHSEKIQYDGDDEDGPIVPTLGDRTEGVQDAVPVTEPITVANDHERIAVHEPATQDVPPVAPVMQVQLAMPEQAAMPEPPMKSSATPPPESDLQKTVEENALESPVANHTVEVKQSQDAQRSTECQSMIPLLMNLGRSAICFDLPENPLEQTHVRDIAQKLQISEVVDIWPGLSNQAERWDLLAEIDPASPWFAEIIAQELQIWTPVERLLFAAALKKAAAEKMQIRDLLLGLLEDNWSPEVLVKAKCSAVNSKALAYTVFDKLGALLLSDVGEAFLDTIPATGADDSKYPSNVSILSVRTISEETAAKLYVVHLDECDGPFVKTIVSLLMEVARRYSVSTRNIKKAAALKERATAEEARLKSLKQEEALKQTRDLLSLLATKLKDAGLDAVDIQAMLVS